MVGDQIIDIDQVRGKPAIRLAGSRQITETVDARSELLAWTARVAARVPRVIVLCSGSFFLAAAGLLEGRRAATHWSVAALQQQRYPAVDVDADAIVVRDGHLWTSAGVTACIDLALDVARDMVMYPKRPGGQSQFSVQFSSQAGAVRWFPVMARAAVV